MASTRYYVPEQSPWPIIGSVGLLGVVLGAVNLFHHNYYFAWPAFIIGLAIMIFTLTGWFRHVIAENRQGMHSMLMDRSYRWGMFWFIFSEIMFFAAFFGALFYARVYSLPWLSGEGTGAETHALLWPDFKYTWPLFVNPNNELFAGPKHILSTWGIPAFNTCLLLTSALTITWAHWALKKNKRSQLVLGLFLTVLLGVIFIGCQVYEYNVAIFHDGLTTASGIYGSTFFLLTGFHGLHVTMGATMLLVIMIRCMKGHFTPEKHFGFEAVAWYWHFVDYVWLTLFVFVYWF